MNHREKVTTAVPNQVSPPLAPELEALLASLVEAAVQNLQLVVAMEDHLKVVAESRVVEDLLMVVEEMARPMGETVAALLMEARAEVEEIMAREAAKREAAMAAAQKHGHLQTEVETQHLSSTEGDEQ